MGKFHDVIWSLQQDLKGAERRLAEKDVEINRAADRFRELQAERLPIVKSIEDTKEAIKVLEAVDTDAA